MDLAEELKNAIHAPANTSTVASCFSGRTDPPGVWFVVQKWFGEVKHVEIGSEEILIFDTLPNGRLPQAVYEAAMDANRRGAHVFEYDHVRHNFVRRDQAWLEHPGRI